MLKDHEQKKRENKMFHEVCSLRSDEVETTC